jgi:multidrug transporter EmrE-like cation transporter
MSPGTLALILVSVTLSAVAQISFKFGMTSTAAGRNPDAGVLTNLLHSLFTPGVLFGLALYGFGTLLWLSALGRVEVSQAYPFVGIGFVLTAVFGHLLFGDAVGVQRALGIMLVIGGIVLVARS